ncbi:MAG TPA: tannase/feruloyl esterase family alpha/beta hydrolase [Ramlibacter sp.]|nr:tannase/feruloyl esterase family alpha/beta hydrolase [Ramlibacter sp.]
MKQDLVRRGRWLPLAAAVAAFTVACGGGGGGEPAPQLAAAVGAPLKGTCTDLTARLSGLADTNITSVSAVAAGTLTVGGNPVREHCLVRGSMHARVSPVDGNNYAIGFEIRLPLDWNGRFLHQGNGGIDGAVVPATGASGGGPLTHALHQGFAVLSSDAGHAGALGPTFGIDPQARLDYGYQAVGKLTPMAKGVIRAAYSKGPDRSYFAGCSNGGRHAMIAATRYAADYDGILAGAPGYNLPKAAIASIAGGQLYASVATDPANLSTAFTTAERTLVGASVTAKCDALDGDSDGLVQDVAACQAAFSLERDVPTCSGARDGTCLSAAQKTAIGKIFSGPTTSNGTQIYASFPYDPGIAGSGIPFWEFTAPLALDSGAVGLIFKVPPENAAGFNGPAFTLSANLDTLVQQITATNTLYTESAMSFMTPPNPTDMSALRDRGGKIIVYHGVSDPIFSVNDTEAWYKGLQARNAGVAQNFARFFRVPGMGHCSGGPATDQFDPLSSLVAWVEQGNAPDRIVASARGAGNAGGANADLPAGWSATRTRPLCPYPLVARYTGGDVESAASFTCAP